MAYQFQAPEVLLSKINKRLLALRGASDSYLEDKKLSEALTQVVRKLLIAELLNETFTISVAGTQGAGKTTLLQSLYQLDDVWIRGNEGRGEKSPLLVLEKEGLTTPEGWVQEITSDSDGRLSISERKLTEAEFQSALRGEIPSQVIPKLFVPGNVIGGEKGFLLLPGYEAKDVKNASWQELMRQSLIGSAMCVLVTDETRLAKDDQKKILRDMYSHYLEGANPLVVISKTENMSPYDRAELCTAAADVFQVLGADARKRIICTGTGEYENAWRPTLIERLNEFSGVVSSVRTRQLSHLSEVLRGELTDVLDDIQDGLREKSIPTEGERDYEAFLEVFDKSKQKLRRTYEKHLKDVLSDFADKAAKAAVTDHIENEEGFLNGVKNIKRWVAKTSGEREEVHCRRINDAWRGLEGKGFFLHHVDLLGRITSDKLGIQPFPACSTGAKASKQHLLGYIGPDKRPLQALNLDATIQENLVALFYPHRDDSGVPINKDAEKAVSLLPALALEFSRLANIFPELAGVDGSTLQKTNLKAAVNRVKDEFEFLRDVKSDLLRSIATMLAIDGAADGKIDTIPALFDAVFGVATAAGGGVAGGATAGGATAGGATAGGATAGGATAGGATAGGATAGGGVVAGGMATAIAGVVAVGILSVAVTRELQRQDAEQRDLCRRIIFAIRDKHYEHYLSGFDDLMDAVRETLDARLRLRYHKDTKLMWHDRVAKPLADVRSLKADMLEAIGGSPFILMA